MVVEQCPHTQVFFFSSNNMAIEPESESQPANCPGIQTKRLTSVNDHGIGWTLLKGRLTLLVPAAAANMAVQPKVTT